MMKNTELWEAFEKTDPRHTKEFSGKGGFSGTAINATYIIKKLTEAFGPCGRGWKFALEEEHIIDGHTLKNGDKAKLHKVLGHLEYYQEGNWYKTSPQFGQTMLVAENKYGTFTDEDAPKKSITDCISKCAVTLGIGADVHLGLFDDSKYVSDHMAEETAGERPARDISAAPPPKPIPKSAGAGVPTSDAAKKAALKFAQDACVDLESITLKEQLTAWLSVNQAKVDKLKTYDQDLEDVVKAAIIEARSRAK